VAVGIDRVGLKAGGIGETGMRAVNGNAHTALKQSTGGLHEKR
jgi:hypothetical protein